MQSFTKAAGLTVVLLTMGGVGASTASAQQPAGVITVDDRGTFEKPGGATISGTYSCEQVGVFAFITGNLVQPVGRHTPIRGDFVAEAVCTGETEVWTATVQGAGKFKGGRAVASASLMVCPEAEPCVSIAETTEELRLKG